MATVKAYGFGSHFRIDRKARDIDVLLLHENFSNESCQHALACKARFIADIPSVDIIILSESEALENKLIDKSRAVFLGNIHESSRITDIVLVTAKIQTWKKPEK